MHRGLNLLAALVVLGGCVNAKQAPQAPQAQEVSVVTVHRQSVPVLAGTAELAAVREHTGRIDRQLALFGAPCPDCVEVFQAEAERI